MPPGGPDPDCGDLKDGESVFDERRSLVFKRLHVVRFYDRERNVLVYVSYSDRVLRGQPQELDQLGAGDGLGRAVGKP